MVEDVAQSIPIPENKTVATIELDSFAVAVMEIEDVQDFIGQDFAVNLRTMLGSDDVTLNPGDIAVNMMMMMTEPTASLSIDETFFQSSSVDQAISSAKEAGNATSNGTGSVTVVPRIINSVYLTAALFPRINLGENQSNESSTTTAPVGSIILSSTLSLTTTTETQMSKTSEVRVFDIDPPITLTFMKNQMLTNGTNPNTSCTFWDFEANSEFWLGAASQPACTLSKIKILVCFCIQMVVVTGRP